MIDKTWRKRWVRPYESFWSICQTYLYVNLVNSATLQKRIVNEFSQHSEQKRAYMWSESLISCIDTVAFHTVNIDELQKKMLPDGHFSNIPSGILKNPLFIDPIVRICPVCFRNQYHSIFHQLKIVNKCVFHGVELQYYKPKGIEKPVEYIIKDSNTYFCGLKRVTTSEIETYKHPDERKIIPEIYNYNGDMYMFPENIMDYIGLTTTDICNDDLTNIYFRRATPILSIPKNDIRSMWASFEHYRHNHFSSQALDHFKNRVSTWLDFDHLKNVTLHRYINEMMVFSKYEWNYVEDYCSKLEAYLKFRNECITEDTELANALCFARQIIGSTSFHGIGSTQFVEHPGAYKYVSQSFDATYWFDKLRIYIAHSYIWDKDTATKAIIYIEVMIIILQDAYSKYIRHLDGQLLHSDQMIDFIDISDFILEEEESCYNIYEVSEYKNLT